MGLPRQDSSPHKLNGQLLGYAPKCYLSCGKEHTLSPKMSLGLKNVKHPRKKS